MLQLGAHHSRRRSNADCWNGNDMTSTLTPSDDFLTLTNPNNNWRYARNITPCTVPFYFEITVVVNSGGNVMVGVASEGSITIFLGGNTGSIGWAMNGATFNTVGVPSIASYAVGNLLRLAFRPQTNRLWGAVENGNWNNSSTANPSSGLGGLDTSQLTGLKRFGAVTQYDINTVTTANFGETNFKYPIPDGFRKLGQ